jgi:ABC-2 type transport system permease protein
MTGAFLAELLKLRRRGLLLGGALVVAFTAFFTIMAIERASNATGERRGFHISITALEKPDGLVHGITTAGTLMGIVMLGIFAAAFGSEYTTGALRNLLVREPRRVRFLAGTYMALVVFGILVILVACAVSIGLTLVLAPSKGIDTSAWGTSTGLSDTWQAIWHLLCSALGYGTIGAALAIIFRSPVIAIVTGVIWLLPIEALLSNLWTGGQDWLPGQLLGNLTDGGSSSLTLARTSVTLVAYWVIVAVGTSALFARRDVAN